MGRRYKRLEALKNKIERLEERLHKKEIAKVDKVENKTIALGTSKLNYLDPRISVAWCKRFGVPIDKVGGGGGATVRCSGNALGPG